MENIQLSKNFWLHEFLRSKSHPEMLKGITLWEEEVDKLYYLVQFGLQPIREMFGPVTITSGYRTVQLNAAVGGTRGSQHVLAEACDFLCGGKEEQVYLYLVNKLQWCGEVILYEGKHIHLSLPKIGVKMDKFIKRK